MRFKISNWNARSSKEAHEQRPRQYIINVQITPQLGLHFYLYLLLFTKLLPYVNIINHALTGDAAQNFI